MSSQYGSHGAWKCIDDNTKNYCHTRGQTNAWLSVELNNAEAPLSVGDVTVWNIKNWLQYKRLGTYQIWVGSTPGQYGAPAQLCDERTQPETKARGPFVSHCAGLLGTHVTLVLPGGGRIINVAELYVDATAQPPAQPPAPPVAPPSPPGVSGFLSLRDGVVRLAFSELTPASLPHGSSLRSAVLHVTPHSSRKGAVVAALRAALDCGGELVGSASDYVEWDVQPFHLGFAHEQSPDFASLLEVAMARRGASQDCSVVITLQRMHGDGERHVHPADAALAPLRPRLELAFDAPTTAAQLAWTADRDCGLTVSVAVPPTANETCRAADVAIGLPVQSGRDCPSLQLMATAATTLDSCAMSVNGLGLFAGCGLDRLVVGRDGVCAAQISLDVNSLPAAPRAACFDTREATGAAELAQWIDGLEGGVTAMVVSCSRFAWGHAREAVGEALLTLGALDPPAALDDAYALIGSKGATAPLAEARGACCENPDPVCLTCDQTPAVARATVACGVPSAPSASLLGDSGFFGAFGSEAHASLVGELTAPVAPAPRRSSLSPYDGISTFQAADADELDAPCADVAALSAGGGEPYGARLASDGDRSTYWLSSGAPDALLTIDLGGTRHVTGLTLDWLAKPRDLLVLYSSQAGGDDWHVGAVAVGGATDTVSLGGEADSTSGVRARRLRLYMANPLGVPAPPPPPPASTDSTGGALPMFALYELHVASCADSELAATLDMRVGRSNVAELPAWGAAHGMGQPAAHSPRDGLRAPLRRAGLRLHCALSGRRGAFSRYGPNAFCDLQAACLRPRQHPDGCLRVAASRLDGGRHAAHAAGRGDAFGPHHHRRGSDGGRAALRRHGRWCGRGLLPDLLARRDVSRQAGRRRGAAHPARDRQCRRHGECYVPVHRLVEPLHHMGRRVHRRHQESNPRPRDDGRFDLDPDGPADPARL